MTTRRRHARATVAVTALILALAGASPASAAWQVSAPVPLPALNAGALGAPTLLSCAPTTVNGLAAARLTWARVTGAKEYSVIATNVRTGQPPELARVQDSTVTGETFSVTVQGGLLGGVVTLLTGNPTVAAVSINGLWRSSPSAAQTVVPGNGLGFVLGGATCP
ncbi:hypothetical protein RWH45_14425 [Microbacterium sp. KSW4-17]|uniref:Ig-like domain-containing protein n=1 Tax=Microbacterium galbum TaxID=3075994 RepID=A0ABU3TAQ3_9MICO|nr:hypothetical protein [Microbacterium sp. KSW4-17]MDU0368412.1 hypothetical protein [Microbacterium sp. KSW4-17]